jgi:hypothetical protein
MHLATSAKDALALLSAGIEPTVAVTLVGHQHAAFNCSARSSSALVICR